ncbi:hypothetical protein GCM10009760_10210 [Kitasatospora kazusensis]|uniref:4-vinyl reductase 4VR domain-containing protein n=1 Tax=Kitasatospora kazusensis TaxID=407974 RepID=A0ABN2YXB4_9ACTN
MAETRVHDRTAAGPRADDVFQFWWLHDARWYQGVLKRFGQDAANEINAEAVKFVARRVAAWHVRSNPVTRDGLTPDELAGHVAAALRLMGTGTMSEVTQQVLDEDSFETVVSKSFALRMLRAAGTLDGYDCPCLELRAGWFEGLRVDVEDSCVECQRTGGEVCRFRAELRRAPESL